MIGTSGNFMAKKKSKKKASRPLAHGVGQSRPYSKSLDNIAANILAQQSARPLHDGGALGALVEKFGQSGSFGKVSASDEEVALSLAGLYFKEVARLGFKRSLEIDDVINAFYYALARIKRKDVESKEVMDVIKRAKSY
ncbi:MAG: hypothetical protein AABW85_04555 [archaeon]